VAKPLPGSYPSGAAGALSGFLVGELEGALSPADRELAYEAQYRALEYGQTGQAVEWEGTAGRARGAVTPGPAYQVNAFNCRDYTHVIQLLDVPTTARGTACRNADGTWSVVT
jgi:surface antigen